MNTLEQLALENTELKRQLAAATQALDVARRGIVDGPAIGQSEESSEYTLSEGESRASTAFTDSSGLKQYQEFVVTEAFTNLIFNQATDAIVVCDRNGKILRLNDAARAQKDQLDSFSRQLADLTALNETKLEGLRQTCGERGIDVDLPPPERTDVQVPPRQIVLEYTSDKRLSINKQDVAPSDLEARLREVFDTRTDKTLFLMAAGSLRYGEIVQVIDAAKGAGVQRVGVVTESMRRQ